MAGLGCCTEGGSSFGSGRGESSSKGGGGDPIDGGGDPIDGGCAPNTIPDNTNPLFGGPKWPSWMAKTGCGIISILMHDEIKHGDKIDDRLIDIKTGNKVYTPKNVEFMRDCFKKKTWWDIAWGGLPPMGGWWHDFEDCKKTLMHELGVEITPSALRVGPTVASGLPWFGDSSTIPSGLCPPLCLGAEAVLYIYIHIDNYIYEPKSSLSWLGISWSATGTKFRRLTPNRSPHAVRGKVISCEKGEEVCFEVQDYKPQYVGPGFEKICMRADGTITMGSNKTNYQGFDSRLPGPLNGEGKVQKFGACQKYFENNSRKQIEKKGWYMGKFPWSRGQHPKRAWRCREFNSYLSGVFGIYVEGLEEFCSSETK